MRSTSDNSPEKKRRETPIGSGFLRFLSGEFLIGENMRPVYVYFTFVMILVASLIVSDQLARDKVLKIQRLENEYKQEIARLKANNQFIPYEENKILIETMKERGYLFDDRNVFSITNERPEEPQSRFFNFFKRNHGKK